MSVDESVPHEPMSEARFIPADMRCPHPERWHSTDGDSTELEVSGLIAGLVRGLQPRLVVETGAAFGQTTVAILEALERNGHGHLFTYENDTERAAWVRRLTLEHAGRLTLAENSLDANLLGYPLLDFAFFDTHYETRVPEFLHFRPWMRKGTIVAFHDTAPGRGAHRISTGESLREQLEAVSYNHMQNRHELRLIDLPTPRGLTLGEVL